MTGSDVPPGLLLIFAGLLLPLLPRALGRALLLLAPLGALWLIWQLPEGGSFLVPFLGYELVVVRADALSRLFGTVFAIAAFGGGLFALNQTRTTELACVLIYAGSAIGIVFAGDLVTLLLFWELMAIASTVVIWCGGPAGQKAGLRYAAVHLLGGVLLMAGVAGEVAAAGALTFDAMQLDTPARWLILAGFLVNAGAPPLSAWISDSYPEASWSGTVFLAAFTTKAAVYVLIRGFPGAEILLPVGMYMVVYGIVFALLENNVRRILSYSIVNQVGLMLVAIGIGTPLALAAASAQAFVHVIYKSLLMMSAGAVLYVTDKRDCTELGGLFRSMPVVTLFAVIGALSISAFPLTSGFATKPMITDAAAGQGLEWGWLLLIAASAGAFLYALKFPWFVFFNRDTGLRAAEPPVTMRLAMLLFAALSIGIGLFPQALYGLLPYAVDYEPYTAGHVLEQLQLLVFAGLAFFLLLPLLSRMLLSTFDLDWYYRRLGPFLWRQLLAGTAQVWGRLSARLYGALERLFTTVHRHHGPHGILARSWPTGSIALWLTILLVAYLGLFYLG
jgi:multicomponent Na+:H+ antiporter subunit D